MMIIKRYFILVFAMVAPLLVLGALALAMYLPGLPGSARSQLDAYLNMKNASARSPLTVLRVQSAAWPWNFTQALSQGSFSDGVYFRPRHTFDNHVSSQPLAYPPQEVWCVTLSGGVGGQTLVLVARHEDLYNSGWVVHDVDGGDQPAAAVAKAVGCQAAK
jgi:hypothetical protein